MVCTSPCVVQLYGTFKTYTILSCEFQVIVRQNESEIGQLREIINEKDEESRKNLSMLDAKLQELEHLKKNIGNMGTVSACYKQYNVQFVFLYIAIPYEFILGKSSCSD